MTHQNAIWVEVTRYLDDVVVRGPRYSIREIDLSIGLSRIVWVCVCAFVMIVVIGGGVMVVRVAFFIVVVIGRPN
jgi:hypothetical protein